MSKQDFEGLNDLYEAINRTATSGLDGPNKGRIHDGCIFISQKEWNLIDTEVDRRHWEELTPVEKLSNIPIRIVSNGDCIKLSDGRIMAAFDDTLYLLPKPKFDVPPLPRLHLDGRYIQ